MRFTYDPEVDILMVHLVDSETAQNNFDRNIRTEAGAVLDVDAEGTVLAMEITGAARRYGAKALSHLPLEGSEPISLAEAAEIGGVSVDSLKFAAQRGRLVAKKIGRNWTTTERELTTYLDSRMHTGPGSAFRGPDYYVLDDAGNPVKAGMLDFPQSEEVDVVGDLMPSESPTGSQPPKATRRRNAVG